MIKKIITSLIVLLLVSHVNAQGNVVIDSDSALSNRMNKRIQSRKYGGKVAGYKMIIYSGKSKTVAMNVRSRFKSSFRTYKNVDLIWDEPRYKVFGGFFFNKFNAQSLKAQLEKQNFPTVIMTHQMFKFPIIPAKFSIED